jgi:hypothetical protein
MFRLYACCRCAIYVKSKEKVLVPQLVRACSAIRQAVDSSSMLLVLRRSAYYVRRLEITWTMSSTVATVSITTQSW